MRPSIVSRSVIAVATLGIGSVALAAVPATAATPSGITREQVLTAAAGVRSAPPADVFGSYGPAANRALKGIVNRACAVDPEGPETLYGIIADATDGGGSADGVVVTAVFMNSDGPAFSPDRVCTFGALATTNLRSVLTGTATISGSAPTALSGDVFVTPGVRTLFGSSSPDPSAIFPTFSASGNAVQSDDVKVADKKTKKEKKAAKTKYDKRLKALKKAYTKALDKAGSSKSKKKTAKAAYSAKKKTAKAAYRYAIAGYKIITTNTPTPFNVTAKYTPAP